MFIVRFKNIYEPVPLFLCPQLKSINLNIQSSNASVKISLLRAWRLPSGSEEAACASCDYGCISGQFASQDKWTRGDSSRTTATVTVVQCAHRQRK